MFTFTVTRATSDDINVPITINFNVGGTATLGGDYTVTGTDSFTATQGSITLTSGLRAKSFTISPVANNTATTDKTISLTPQAQAGVFVVANGSNWTATIVHAPVTPPAPSGVVLLLNFQGTDNSTVFTDTSPSPRAVITGGNAKIVNNKAVFDGDNDYLQIAKAQLDISTFPSITIEALYTSNTALDQIVAATYTTYNLNGESGHLTFLNNVMGNGTLNFANYPATPNALIHTAFVYDGNTGTAKCYQNGILVGSAQIARMLQNGDFFIGGSPGARFIGGMWFNGTMTGFRISNTALYTANFTPPTTFNSTPPPPPTPVSPGTILLLRFQGADNSTAIVDSSNTPKTVQAFGNAKIVGNKCTFDGLGDYLQIDKNQLDLTLYPNLTVEFIYETANTSFQILATTYNISTGQSGHFVLLCDRSSNGNTDIGAYTITPNVVAHLAYVYDNSVGQARVYYNGVLAGTSNSAHTLQNGALWVGGSPGDNNLGNAWFNGKMTGLKISNTVLYTANFTPPTSF